MSGKYVFYEMKKWMRDPMTIFLIVYALIFALIVRFGVPFAEEQFRISLASYYHVLLGGIMLITAALTGGVIGFSVLGDRDDKILYAIGVSPVSFDTFMVLKFCMSFALTYVSCIMTILIADIGTIPLYALLLVPVPISLFSSISAMIINCFASNKVEGFAMMKAGAIIIVFPIVSLFFTDYKEFFFGFEPNFWAVKALSTAMQPNVRHNLEFWGYYTVGLIYVSLLNGLVYKVFKKRVIM